MDDLLLIAKEHAANLHHPSYTSSRADTPSSYLDAICLALGSIPSGSPVDHLIASITGLIANIGRDRIKDSLKSDDWRWFYSGEESSRPAQGAKLLNIAHHVTTQYSDNITALLYISSLMFRLTIINSTPFDSVSLHFLSSKMMQYSPSATLAAMLEAIPFLLDMIDDDNCIGRLSNVLLPFASHSSYSAETCLVLAPFLPDFLKMWLVADTHKGTVIRLITMLVNDSATADVFQTESPSGATFSSILLDNIIDRNNGMIININGLAGERYEELLESLRLIGRIAHHSRPAADAFAKQLFDHDIFINDLLRGLKPDSSKVISSSEIGNRLSLCARLIEAFTGIVCGASFIKTISERSARSRIETHLIDAAADHWNLFIKPVSNFLIVMDRYRSDKERAVLSLTSKLSMIEIVKRLPRMISRHDHPQSHHITYSQYDEALSLIPLIKLLTLFARHNTPSSSSPSSPQDQLIHRVVRAVIKRILDILSTIHIRCVKQEALTALQILGISDHYTQLTDLLSNSNTLFVDHRRQSSISLLYITFQAIRPPCPFPIDYGKMVGSILALFEDCYPTDGEICDPLLTNPTIIYDLRSSCVKLLHLSWRIPPFAKAISIIPFATVRSIICQILSAEFLPILEAPDAQIPSLVPLSVPADIIEEGVNDDQDRSVMIEQTLLGFSSNTLLSVIDELFEIVDKAEMLAKTEDNGPLIHIGLRSRLQWLIVRCLQQIGDHLNGDRKDDIVDDLLRASTFQDWIGARNGRRLAICNYRDIIDNGLSGNDSGFRVVPATITDIPDIVSLVKEHDHHESSDISLMSHWKRVISGQVNNTSQHFLLYQVNTISSSSSSPSRLIGLCGIDQSHIDTFVIRHGDNPQTIYNARLELLSYMTRWAGLRSIDTITITLPNTSPDSSWMAIHDNVFRIKAIAPPSLTYQWTISLDDPLEERIHHDLATTQGQIRSILIRKVHQPDDLNNPLLNGVSRIQSIIGLMMPDRANHCQSHSPISQQHTNLESIARQMYERVMRSNAGKLDQDLVWDQNIRPEPHRHDHRSGSTPSLESLLLSDHLALEQDRHDHVWTAPSIGTVNENLIQYTTQYIDQQRYNRIPISSDPSGPVPQSSTPIASRSTRRSTLSGRVLAFPTAISPVLGQPNHVIPDGYADPASSALSSFIRILYIISTQGTETDRRKAHRQILKRPFLMLLQNWVLEKEFEGSKETIDRGSMTTSCSGDHDRIGGNLLAILSETLHRSAWGTETFIESCEAIELVVNTAKCISGRLAQTIQCRNNTRRLPESLEIMMASCTNLIRYVLETIPMLHFLDRLSDLSSPESVSIDDGPSHILYHHNHKMQLMIIDSLFANGLLLADLREFIDYDMELSNSISKQGISSYFSDYRPGMGRVLDSMRHDLIMIMGRLMSSGPNMCRLVLHSYTTTTVKYDISLRSSLLSSVLSQAAIASLTNTFNESLLNSKVFAAGETIEFMSLVETYSRSVLTGTTIKIKLLILSCHYIYLSESDVSPDLLTYPFTMPSITYRRLHYSNIYECRYEVTGQIAVIGHQSTNGFMSYHVWILRRFGSVHLFLEVMSRNCSQFCTTSWKPINEGTIEPSSDIDGERDPIDHEGDVPITTTNMVQARVQALSGKLAKCHVEMATSVDVLKESGLLERRTLCWVRYDGDSGPNHAMCIIDDMVDLHVLTGLWQDGNTGNLRPLSSVGWFTSVPGDILELSQLETVELTETVRPIMVLRFTTRSVNVFFICDNAREVWNQAIQTFLLGDTKHTVWHKLMIPARQIDAL